MSEHETTTILLVDDDEIDVRAVTRDFEQHRIAASVRVAHDGVDALEMLRGEGGHERVERPLLILLDLKLPRMNGLEFLAQLRGDPRLNESVVIVLTTSDDERDRSAAYDHQVAGYVLKNSMTDDVSDLVRLVEQFTTSSLFPASAKRV